MDGRRLGRDEVRTLVLHILTQGPSHGYAIARAVEAASASALRLGEGTLYPVLRELEDDQLVVSNWAPTGNGPARKMYKITSRGRGECAERVRQWRSYVDAMDAVLTQRGLANA